MQHDAHCLAWVSYRWGRCAARHMATTWSTAFDKRNWFLFPNWL
jgi:hypothetical protein